MSEPYLTTCQLTRAHVLSYELGATPDRSWGSAPADAPPSQSAQSQPVARCAARLAAGA